MTAPATLTYRFDPRGRDVQAIARALVVSAAVNGPRQMTLTLDAGQQMVLGRTLEDAARILSQAEAVEVEAQATRAVRDEAVTARGEALAMLERARAETRKGMILSGLCLAGVVVLLAFGVFA
jgi:hypothetical protein